MKRKTLTVAVLAALAFTANVASAKEPAPKDKPKEMKPITVTAVMAAAALTMIYVMLK